MALAWSRKHAHTQARLCERFAAPVIAGQRCQGINVSHMREIGECRAYALSADGKGVAMRRESRRRRTVAPGRQVRNFSTRPGIGERGHKRIAEVACVFDVIPAARTPPG